MQYKTVAGPIGLTIEKNGSAADAVKQYASIINQETAGGWKLLCIEQVPVSQKNGCIQTLMGNPYSTSNFNMLVFC
ncbi:MAG: hypothetical protein IKM24_11200, partial [Clostridia bacterium]|nr:hypothetical protein [Clostridia bacterium]